MSAPLIVSIPHRLGREEASRRLKAGLTRAAASIPVRQIEVERWEGDRLFFRARARAGSVRSCRRRGGLCPAGSHATLAIAAFCQSSAGRDQKSWQSAADQAELSNDGTRHYSVRAIVLELPFSLVSEE